MQKRAKKRWMIPRMLKKVWKQYGTVKIEKTNECPCIYSLVEFSILGGFWCVEIA